VIEVLLTTVTFVAGTPAKVTVAPEKKFVPVIVTAVPPEAGPLVGLMLVMVGAGKKGMKRVRVAVDVGDVLGVGALAAGGVRGMTVAVGEAVVVGASLATAVSVVSDAGVGLPVPDGPSNVGVTVGVTALAASVAGSVRVGVTAMIADGVLVGDADVAAVGVAVIKNVPDGVAVTVAVGDAVALASDVAVIVGVGDGTPVGRFVEVGIGVLALVGSPVAVNVAVEVMVADCVGVGEERAKGTVVDVVVLVGVVGAVVGRGPTVGSTIPVGCAVDDVAVAVARAPGRSRTPIDVLVGE
jgi:hypothetical protein